MKMIKGQRYFSYKGRLRELRLFRLEKRKLMKILSMCRNT